MTPEDFAALAAQDYNRIPVSIEVLADLETPLSAYRKVAEGAHSYLFESVQGGEKWGRYSIIGLPCRTLLKVFGHRVEIWVDGKLIESEEVTDPLAYAEAFGQRYKTAPQANLPVFHGGLVGYFGYDTVRYIEPKLRDSAPPDRLGNPDILLMVSEEVLVFDNLAGTIRVIVNVDPTQNDALRRAEDRLQNLAARLSSQVETLPPVILDAADRSELESLAESDFTREEYEISVNKVKEYVLAGDVMQVVPSQRMSIPFTAPPLNLYRALRNLNPSPYMF